MDSMAGEPDKVGQDEIEQLLQQAQRAAGQAVDPLTAQDPEVEPAPMAAGGTSPGPAPAIEMQTLSAPARATTATASSPFAPQQQPRPRPASADVGDDINFLLQQAEQAIASVDQPVNPAIDGVKPFQFRDFTGTPPSGEKATLELLKDVDLDLRIELGRTQMYLEDVLKLKRGSVVALDKLAGDPVNIHVNGRLIARGEVLVLNDNFCVRVAELLSGDDVQ